MYVLATMMLLMAIGVSAITAAGMNAGAAAVQRDRTQLDIYSSSMERTIMSSLENTSSINPGVPVSSNATLSGRILFSIIESMFEQLNDLEDDDEYFFGNPFNIDITDEILIDVTTPAGVAVNANYDAVRVIPNITIKAESFPRAGEIDFINVDADGNPFPDTMPINLTPMTLTLSGEIRIRISTSYTPPGGVLRPAGLAVLQTITETTYRLTPVSITEIDVPNKTAWPVSADMIFESAVANDWLTVIKHETIMR